MNFKTFIKDNIVVFDGAMGTMLQLNGLKAGDLPEKLNVDNCELIEKIHNEYIDAGADVITTNTFGANCRKMAEYGLKDDEIIEMATKIARKSADSAKKNQGRHVFVAQDIGPIGELLEPLGTLNFDDAYDIFARQVKAGVRAGVDLFLLETMTDLYEAKAAVLAVKENSNLPCVCTMTFEENARTFTGCEISSMAITLEALGADAVGINCSLGPDEIFSMAKKIVKWTSLPILIQPNAGLPDLCSSSLKYDISSEEFAAKMKEYFGIGVTMVGGCCGTTPEYIALMRKEADIFKKSPQSVYRKRQSEPCICTPSKTLVIDSVKIIGERINPTGKKAFKQALKDNDINYILNQALEQEAAGADILDINVGLPEIDETQMMERVVKSIQQITDIPLQIDSSDPKALERGLRIYNGVCIVNSVNGDEETLDAILPLVKKYGACVVGLTIDKNGVPKSSQKRIEIAEYIKKKALYYGIDSKKVFIDCLVLTASAQQSDVQDTLQAVKYVAKNMQMKTVLGVSNVSFGLPSREAINRTFLALALENGLIMPIMNPNIRSMTDTVLAYKVLKNIDKNSAGFIEYQSNHPVAEMIQTKCQTAKPQDTNENTDTIEYALKKGLQAKAFTLTNDLLKSKTADEIINQHLIPSLDKVGEEFEKGIIFLPQLIQSAEAAKGAFNAIKENMLDNGKPRKKGEKIILATVQGDVHDIGKNIVKVILENYGYDVIDLGKNVPIADVVNAAIEQEVKLIGLSALMTTTIKNMEKTISAIRQSGHICKIMVGGAVLTEEYAMAIGADFFAKDAKVSVEIAKKVFS